MAHPGSLGERFEGVEERTDPVIGCVEVVLGDVVPNVVQIQLGGNTQNVPAHAPIFLRARDLPSNRSRAASGSTCTPRSNEVSL